MHIKLLKVFIASSVAIASLATHVAPALAVKGGQEAPAHFWKWQVRLSNTNKIDEEPYCGGVLISASWVLTAAHCVVDEVPEDVFVTLGDHNWSVAERTEQVIGAKRFIVHPDFDDEILAAHDVALIELQKPAKLNAYVKPVRFASGALEEKLVAKDAIVTVTGWGAWNRFFGMQSRVLNQGTVKVVNTSDKIAPVIVTKADNGAPCWGDSGGPVVARSRNEWLLVGIVSIGICTVSESPSAYPRVSRYIDWINRSVGANIVGVVSK